MHGIRTKEDVRFKKYFKMFQEEISKRGFVYFLDHTEAKKVCFQDMVCIDMHGWLLPESLADEFEAIFLKNDKVQWDYTPFVYVDYEIKDSQLSFIVRELELIDDFYCKGKEYCKYISEKEITTASLPVIIVQLMNLYVAALKLPEMSISPKHALVSAALKPKDIRICEEIELFYWEIFDPHIEGEPVRGNIIDDLVDIANDLLQGIAEYDSRRIANAVFEWRLGFSYHWGNHVVDVLRVLHHIRTMGENVFLEQRL